MRRALTSTAVLALLLSAMMVIARPVAAGGNGAQTGGGPVNVHDCTDFVDVTTCHDATGEYHYVYTPSGGYNTQFNGTECYTVTDNGTGEVLARDCVHIHEQFHTKQDEVKVAHRALTETYTSVGQTCTTSVQFHEVNGVVQFDRYTTTCV